MKTRCCPASFVKLWKNREGFDEKKGENVKNRIWVILLIASLILSGIIFFFFYGAPWNVYQFSNKFESYLAEKYKGDFKIEAISYDVLHQTYHAQAYEIKEPEIKFHVGQNSGDKEISDSYELERTAEEASNTVTEIVKKYIPDYTKVNVEVVSAHERELEINVWSEEKVEEQIKRAVKTEIMNEGFKADQLFFNRN